MAVEEVMGVGTWTAQEPNQHGNVAIFDHNEESVALVFSHEYDDADDPLPPTDVVNLFLASRDLLAACEAIDAATDQDELFAACILASKASAKAKGTS